MDTQRTGSLRDAIAATARVVFASGFPGDPRKLAGLIYPDNSMLAIEAADVGYTGEYDPPATANVPQRAEAASVIDELAFLDG